MVTKSCTLGGNALTSVGTCSVKNGADQGVIVTITTFENTRGEVVVDMANSNGGNIEWSCALDGTAHACSRIVDTGGPNAGTWTVTGRMVASNLADGDSHAVMSVDFRLSF